MNGKVIKAAIVAIAIIIVLAGICSVLFFYSTKAAGNQDATGVKSANTSPTKQNATAGEQSNLTLPIAEKEDLQIPDNDTIIAGIHWENYSLLGNPKVTKAAIAPPNSAINHSFITVKLAVDVKGPDNVDEIYSQLSGVVIELRHLLGPDSAPDVWGIYNGGTYFDAIVRPYEDTIYRYDYYHPRSNMTLSKLTVASLSG